MGFEEALTSGIWGLGITVFAALQNNVSCRVKPSSKLPAWRNHSCVAMLRMHSRSPHFSDGMSYEEKPLQQDHSASVLPIYASVRSALNP